MFDRRLLINFDFVFWGIVLLISSLGVVAIYSAEQGYQPETHYWIRQLIWLGGGFFLLFLVLTIDFHFLGNLAYFLHFLVVLMLLFLDVSGGGGSGVNRWFLLGPVALQPSEFVKISTILATAQYFRSSRHFENPRWDKHLVPLVILGIPFFFIVRQPDLGTALLLVLNHIPLAVLGGIRLRSGVIFLVLGLVFGAALLASFQFGYYSVPPSSGEKLRAARVAESWIQPLEKLEGNWFSTQSKLAKALTKENPELKNLTLPEGLKKATFQPFISHILRPYQQKRLVTFVNPNKDPLGAGYHVIQSKIAIGSGQLWGQGYLQGTQGQLNFLPARHTDFLFSVFAEEWGFLGSGSLLLLYSLLFLRGFYMALHTRDRFGVFLTTGILSIIFVQVVINLGMVLGLLPVVGVPLPLFSYGGSSMLTTLLGVGLILNVRMRRFQWD